MEEHGTTEFVGYSRLTSESTVVAVVPGDNGTVATEAAAKEAGVGFVDLFHPSLDLFKAAKEPLTINGVHLSAEGNRQLAEVIAKALLGKQVTASASLEELREAVMDKDLYWNARYRARDGNDRN